MTLIDSSNLWAFVFGGRFKLCFGHYWSAYGTHLPHMLRNFVATTEKFRCTQLYYVIRASIFLYMCACLRRPQSYYAEASINNVGSYSSHKYCNFGNSAQSFCFRRGYLSEEFCVYNQYGCDVWKTNFMVWYLKSIGRFFFTPSELMQLELVINVKAD